jgi:hypothetical protein
MQRKNEDHELYKEKKQIIATSNLKGVDVASKCVYIKLELFSPMSLLVCAL